MEIWEKIKIKKIADKIDFIYLLFIVGACPFILFKIPAGGGTAIK